MSHADRHAKPPVKELFNGVTDGLKKLYARKIRPVEGTYQYDQFYSPLLTDADIDAKPMVLLLGQYSVGKTSFIKYLLGRDFPGAHIGPEPTTDRFMAIMHGQDERVIPGNALAVQADKPFRALQRFGTGFLNKFAGSQLQSELLEHITFIDTPGVLSGEKQRLGRSYEFTEVVEWFAERADMILLLFDAHKLDISDEFRATIQVLKAHDDKVRVVLNKADMISTQQLMRVYGAMMWSLGKCIQTPEVPRVYIGSFWDQSLKNEEMRPLFEAEMKDLITDLKMLPRNNAMRKVNELVKRARLAKVHAYIIGHLKEQMPSFFGREKAQKKLIKNLPDEFNKLRLQYHLPVSDFPSLERFRQTLELLDFDKFAKPDHRMIAEMDNVLAVDIPDLLKRFPVEPEAAAMAMASAMGNPFAETTPFAAAQVGLNWVITDPDREKYALQFATMQPVGGRLSGAQIKPFLVQSKLSTSDLMRIWTLSDMDKDAHLSFDEFCVCMYLVHARLCGAEVPQQLPESLVQSLVRSQQTPQPPQGYPPQGQQGLAYPQATGPAPPLPPGIGKSPPPPAPAASAPPQQQQQWSGASTAASYAPQQAAAPAVVAQPVYHPYPTQPPQQQQAPPQQQHPAMYGQPMQTPPQPMSQPQQQQQQYPPQQYPPPPARSQSTSAPPPPQQQAPPPQQQQQQQAPPQHATPSGYPALQPTPPAPAADLNLDAGFNPFADGGPDNPFLETNPLLPQPPQLPGWAAAAPGPAAVPTGGVFNQFGPSAGMTRLQ